ncbi:hypothetical protein B296_00053886, partial [Ensete ventricosum]
IKLIPEKQKQKQQSKSDLNTQPDRSAPLSRPRVRRFHGCSNESWNLDGIASGLLFLFRFRPASTPPLNSSSLFSTLSILPSSLPTSLLRVRAPRVQSSVSKDFHGGQHQEIKAFATTRGINRRRRQIQGRIRIGNGAQRQRSHLEQYLGLVQKKEEILEIPTGFNWVSGLENEADGDERLR